MSPAEIAALMQLAREQGILPGLDGKDDQENRPRVRLPGEGREMIFFAVETGEILGRCGLFRRERRAVFIDEGGRLCPMNAQMLRTWAEKYVQFFHEKVAGHGTGSRTYEVVKTMNAETARGLVESVAFTAQLPEIRRVNQVRLPSFRKDGRLELLPAGYCAESGIYTRTDGLAFDVGRPGAEGRAILDDLLREFPFQDARSRAVAVAAMLTLFCACLLPRGSIRPGFIYDANTPGAGKTLLAKMAIIPVSGTAAARAMPKREEVVKVLDSLVLDAASYVLFDNIRGKLGGAEIESFLTAPFWEGRVFGGGDRFSVENDVTCFFTGNDSNTSQDMDERCLVVDLFVREFDSRDRKISRYLTHEVLAKPELRSKVLGAMWSLVRGWDAAGRPRPTSMHARCFDWSAIVAGIVEQSGYGDPCHVAPSERRRVPCGMQALVVALAPLQEGVARKEWTFAEVIDQVRAGKSFEDAEVRGGNGEAVEVFDNEGSMTSAGHSYFGKLFRSFSGRVFPGPNGEVLRFEVTGGKNCRRFEVIVES